jgi:transketolase
MNRTPGIDFTTGSLGQGASAAAGIALADRMKQIEAFTYLIIGDGESQEGQVWEAAMFANHYHLGNLIAFHDYNKMQIDGTTVEVMGIDDVNTKWHGFGWHVQRVNGHELGQLQEAVLRAQKVEDRPSVIICDTVKAKGFSLAEGEAGSHNMPFTYEQAQEAIAALDTE